MHFCKNIKTNGKFIGILPLEQYIIYYCLDRPSIQKSTFKHTMKQSKLSTLHIYSLNPESMQWEIFSKINNNTQVESILYYHCIIIHSSIPVPIIWAGQWAMWNYGHHGSQINNNNHWIFASKAKPFELLFGIRICNAKMLQIVKTEMKISHCDDQCRLQTLCQRFSHFKCT